MIIISAEIIEKPIHCKDDKSSTPYKKYLIGVVVFTAIMAILGLCLGLFYEANPLDLDIPSRFPTSMFINNYRKNKFCDRFSIFF